MIIICPNSFVFKRRKNFYPICFLLRARPSCWRKSGNISGKLVCKPLRCNSFAQCNPISTLLIAHSVVQFMCQNSHHFAVLQILCESRVGWIKIDRNKTGSQRLAPIPQSEMTFCNKYWNTMFYRDILTMKRDDVPDMMFCKFGTII